MSDRGPLSKKLTSIQPGLDHGHGLFQTPPGQWLALAGFRLARAHPTRCQIDDNSWTKSVQEFFSPSKSILRVILYNGKSENKMELTGCLATNIDDLNLSP